MVRAQRIQGDDRAQRIRWWRIQGGGFSRVRSTGGVRVQRRGAGAGERAGGCDEV